MPRQVLREDPADCGPGGKPDGGGRGDHAKGRAEHIFREIPDAEQRRDGGDHRGPGPCRSRAASRMSSDGAIPQAAEPSVKMTNPSKEQFFCIPPAREFPEDDEESCHHEQVRDDDPADRPCVGVEVRSHRGERHVHDGTVDPVHDDPERDGAEQEFLAVGIGDDGGHVG